MLKEGMQSSYDRQSEELMDTPNTTSYQKNNPGSSSQMDDYQENSDNTEDGPTLVFDDFDQSSDLNVPAYIRKQK